RRAKPSCESSTPPRLLNAPIRRQSSLPTPPWRNTGGRTMTSLQFHDDAIEVDAAVVADGLGLQPAHLMERMRDGRVTSVCETGTEDDSGRFRLTFFSESRRLRL